MNNKPILSICIPTYNREKYLEECLESIIHQEWFSEEGIEIIISDNASIDNTSGLVKKYQDQYPNIKYFRNDENIGPLKNILKLPNYANGEYIWFLSDDDMMTDITIKTTIEVIEKEKPWLILSKMYWFWDWDQIDQAKINRKWSITNNIWMEKFFNFLARIHYDITPYMMAFSIFCFKREMYFSHLDQLLQEHWPEYIETLSTDYFPHSRILFIPFGNQEIITIIEKDLILCRWNNISWDFKWKACKDLLSLINDLKQKYTLNKKTYKKMKNLYYYSVFWYVCMVHIKKYVPAFVYSFMIYIWRKLIYFIGIVRNV
jgi:glycosyltransferase involved in cell wall biosynthesis